MTFLEMCCGYRVKWTGVLALVLLRIVFAKLPMSAKDADSAIYTWYC